MSPTKPADWDPRSAEVLDDQIAAYDAMRQRCPVAHSDYLWWSVFRHEDVKRVLEDHVSFSNAASNHLSIPNAMDPPEHTPYRKIIEAYYGRDAGDHIPFERVELFAARATLEARRAAA